MLKMEEFLLRSNKTSIRKAVAAQKDRFEAEMPGLLLDATKTLISWAGENSARQGYQPISAEIRPQEMDYSRQIGLVIFLEAEKYDDVRGFLLTAFQEANVLHDQNIFLQNKNSSLAEKVKELHKEHPELAEKFFPDICKQSTWDKEWNEEYD